MSDEEADEQETLEFMARKDPLVPRKCLNCDRKFMARGRMNRLCAPCKQKQPTSAVDWVLSLGKKDF